MVCDTQVISNPILEATDQLIGHEIKILRLFFERRSIAMQQLFEEKLLPSYMRDELVRETILSFTQKQPLQIGRCQRLLERYGSPALFRQELRLLELNNLIFLEKDIVDRKENLIRPTQKLVNFYRFQMPRLEADVRQIFNIKTEIERR